MAKKSKNESSGTWFEVVAHSDNLGKRVIEVPEGERYTVRGPVGGVMVVSIPHETLAESVKTGAFDAMMTALSTAVRGGGFEGGLLIVPEGLGFMKLNPVDRVTAKLLEQRDQREKAEYQARIEKIKREQDGKIPELKPDTETEGEA